MSNQKPPFLEGYLSHSEVAAGFGWSDGTLSTKKWRGDIDVESVRVGPNEYSPPDTPEKITQQLLRRRSEMTARRRGAA
jgi:hypothetical protein